MSAQVIECDQGSLEWRQARAGVITASMFAEVRKRVGGLDERQAAYVAAVRSGSERKEAAREVGYKSTPSAEKIERAIDGEAVGDYTEAAYNYAFRLAVERISGEPLDDFEFETYHARRGHELEPEARSCHAFIDELEIDKAGFVVTEDGKFGASADGLIGEYGGAEYKCFVAPEKLRSIILNNDISDSLDQVHGGLWISGRRWWHWCLYCPPLRSVGLDFIRHHIDRDDDYIEAMERDLWAFDGVVEDYRKKLTEHA